MAMKKKGYRNGGKIGMRSKGMKNGGKVAQKKKAMTVAQLRAAAKKMGYKVTKA